MHLCGDNDSHICEINMNKKKYGIRKLQNNMIGSKIVEYGVVVRGRKANL